MELLIESHDFCRTLPKRYFINVTDIVSNSVTRYFYRQFLRYFTFSNGKRDVKSNGKSNASQHL